MRYTARPEDGGKTVKALIGELIRPSTKLLKALKYREDGILLSGKRVTVRAVVQAGDVLELALENDPPAANAPEPVDLPIGILFEDADLVVPTKPGNMPTHPSHDHHRDTVANALAYRYRDAGAYIFRPVNRLDRETSGLLLVARNRLAAGRLTAAMQSGEIHKTYLAVLRGELFSDAGEIALPLHRSRASIIVREICPPDAPDAEPALTRFRVLERRAGYTLAEASPVTGRTHQLRVHFASQGCPIVGDSLYGSPDARIGRQALHARTLSFPHPASGERLSLTAPLPADFAALVRTLFPDQKGLFDET